MQLLSHWNYFIIYEYPRYVSEECDKHRNTNLALKWIWRSNSVVDEVEIKVRKNNTLNIVPLPNCWLLSLSMRKLTEMATRAELQAKKNGRRIICRSSYPFT